MQLLILSCNTGEGHNSAAKAIKDYLESNGELCTVKDALSYWSEETSKIISRGHVFIYRNLPKLFGVGYRFEENHKPKSGEESLMYELVINGCKSLAKEFQLNHYDAVICTHVFSAMMITELKKSNILNIPAYFVATDYTCSPGVGETTMDGYFIPHSMLLDEFVRGGIPQDLLIPSGIPVKPSFYEKILKSEAKKRLGFDENKKLVLLACGSMGCGPIKSMSESLAGLLSDNVLLTVICGNNKRLYNSLSTRGFEDNVKITGFTTHMNLYMDAADLIITKPGGLSSTEAAIKKLPMIFINAVPGCETRNLEFFVSNGFAGWESDTSKLINLICNCISDDQKLDEMSKKLSEAFNFNANQIIYESIKRRVYSGTC